MRTLVTYKQILRKKGLYVCLQETLYRVWRLRYIRDISLVKANDEYRVYAYLKRHYASVLKSSDAAVDTQQTGEESTLYTNKIWVLWLQGEEQAPPLVKRCIASQKRYAGDMEVVVLTEKNLPQYVHLPEYIVRKHKEGKISFTHLSDIIRVALLAEHGGLWLDATCLLTDTLPEYITHPRACFCFRNPFSGQKVMRISSWLLSARPNDPLIVTTRNLLYAYWKRENRLRNYYLFHLCFSLASKESAAGRAIWNEMPYLNNSNPHMLQEQLLRPYQKEWMGLCKSFTPVHKLTYKYKATEQEIVGTYLEHVLQNTL